MDLVERLGRALDYVEENLDGEIHYAHAAERACCSAYQFTRMFGYITGVSLSEYIRRRRLSRAAEELNQGGKVVDLALKYGYDSPTAFNRAFRTVHGMSPAQAKRAGVVLRSYPRIQFQLSIKGVVAMDYRIEQKEAFAVVGFKKWVSLENEQNMVEIPKFWRDLSRENCEAVMKTNNAAPQALLGVCADMHNNGFDYYIAAAATGPAPEGMERLEVPASTWAVFESVGPLPDALQKVWKAVYADWLPSSGYDHAQTPELEVYAPGDNTAADYRCELWIPVVKK